MFSMLQQELERNLDPRWDWTHLIWIGVGIIAMILLTIIVALAVGGGGETSTLPTKK